MGEHSARGGNCRRLRWPGWWPTSSAGRGWAFLGSAAADRGGDGEPFRGALSGCAAVDGEFGEQPEHRKRRVHAEDLADHDVGRGRVPAAGAALPVMDLLGVPPPYRCTGTSQWATDQENVANSPGRVEMLGDGADARRSRRDASGGGARSALVFVQATPGAVLLRAGARSQDTPRGPGNRRRWPSPHVRGCHAPAGAPVRAEEQHEVLSPARGIIPPTPAGARAGELPTYPRHEKPPLVRRGISVFVPQWTLMGSSFATRGASVVFPASCEASGQHWGELA